MSPGAWSLNVYNLRTGAFQRVVSGVSSETVYGWTSAPVLSHDTLIWSQMTPFKGNGPEEGYKHILVSRAPARWRRDHDPGGLGGWGGALLALGGLVRGRRTRMAAATSSTRTWRPGRPCA